MRLTKAAVCTLLLSLILSGLEAGDASAQCRVCSPFLHCLSQTPGAKLCVESPGVCSMLLPCFGGGGRIPDSPDEGLLTITLFDAEGTTPSVVDTDAGPLAVGHEARGRARGQLAAAMLAHGRDYTVWFADAAERGFAIQRSEAGGAVHVQVLAVTAGVRGAVLATALLLPQDRLRVPVEVEGRPRELVVQAAVVSPGQLVAKQAHLRNALRQAGREIGEPTKPLLEPRPL